MASGGGEMITPEKLAELLGKEYHDGTHCNKCKAFPDLADTIEVLWKANAELLGRDETTCSLLAILAFSLADDYEKYVDNDHDDSCGDHPTCVHTAKWDNARNLKERIVALWGRGEAK